MEAEIEEVAFRKREVAAREADVGDVGDLMIGASARGVKGVMVGLQLASKTSCGTTNLGVGPSL